MYLPRPALRPMQVLQRLVRIQGEDVMSPESDDEDGSTTLTIKTLPKQREVGDKIRDIRARLRECQQAYEKIMYNSSQEKRKEGWAEAYSAAEQAQHLCFDLKDMFGLE